jgi:ATP-dependent Lhr-like helicase
LHTALVRIAGQQLLIKQPARISPMGFPLWAERIASQTLRIESGADRIERLARQSEAAAGEINRS